MSPIGPCVRFWAEYQCARTPMYNLGEVVRFFVLSAETWEEAEEEAPRHQERFTREAMGLPLGRIFIHRVAETRRFDLLAYEAREQEQQERQEFARLKAKFEGRNGS